MGLFDRLGNRPLTRDGFAKLVIKRLRASGETGQIEYDPQQFRLLSSKDRVFFLNNFYQQYQRLPESEHEDVIRAFLTTWHTSGLEPPEEFADAKADLLPALRGRSYLEIEVHRVSDTFRSEVDIPHQVIAEHLAVYLVYDLPESMMTVSNELLDQWGVTFYEALEVAKENLQQNTSQYAKAGDMYVVISGDAYDPSRMILTDFIRQLQVAGDTIAMVPNREGLFVCGSEDDASLAMMIQLAKQNIQHERNISSMAFRLNGDEWEVWQPPEDHPSYPDFHEIYLQTLGQTYAAQKDLFDRRRELEHTDIFVASYSADKSEKTGRVASYCMWCDGIDSFLPETDEVVFFRPEAPEKDELAARGTWETVRRIMGDLMEPQGTYPERWRVREFPSSAMLESIGLMHEG